MEINEKLKNIVKTLDTKKAENVQVIRVNDLTVIADYFVIATGNSNTQVKSLADYVEFNLKEVKPHHIEGYDTKEWIVLDYGDIIVHIFYKETREYYKLERLWSDGEEIDIKTLV
ncbi:MAG: ribosome silencing factor [Oscillospiraceae bacterium]|jgi:ribosome-associated protein|nr:ribosome silencing factor [Oscillospiraceae bacterium]